MFKQQPAERILSALLCLGVLVFCGLIPALVVAQPASCVAGDWDSAHQYYRGDFARHQNHGWKAKRDSKNVEPGSHKPSWQDQGACSSAPPPPSPEPIDMAPLQIFGVWHSGDHYADWALETEMVTFAEQNAWLVDQGDVDHTPSVNLVVLSFLHPIEVLTMEPLDPTTGVPPGMTVEVVEFFKAAKIRVMMSIGGVTYTDAWDEALAINATRLGLNAAEIAGYFDVGIEIDYERNIGANLEGLEEFIRAYRSVHPYDASGTNHAARLTIDLAAGGRYLQELNRHATVHWLKNDAPVLDYANAMVARRSGTPDNWQEHVDGMPTYDPVIPPKAPNRFTGGLYLKGNTAHCLDFASSEQARHAGYVRSVAPNGAGTTSAMLGYMFWAAGIPSARKNYVPTFPPNSCEDGMGTAMTEFEVPIPMPALRQDSELP